MTELARRKRRRRPDVRRAVILFPSGLTLGNLFFGVFAIIAASRLEFVAAGVYVLVGGIFDAFDGRVARATNAGTEFGEELDSLVDAITFGLAPAMIMYFAVLNRSGWDWVWVFLFAACAVLRLARFNIEQAGTAKTYFQGLPSPAAGITLASYYWFSQSSLYTYGAIADLKWHVLLRYLMVVLSILMISNVPYPAFPRTGFRSLRAMAATVLLIGSMILLVTRRLEYFFPFALIYVAWGLLRWVFSGLFERRQPTLPYDLSEGEDDDEEEDDDDEDLDSEVHTTKRSHRERARAERDGRSERPDRAERPERAEVQRSRLDRASSRNAPGERPVERTARAERPERAERSGRDRQSERTKREGRSKERARRGERLPREQKPDAAAAPTSDIEPSAASIAAPGSTSGVDAITLGGTVNGAGGSVSTPSSTDTGLETAPFAGELSMESSAIAPAGLPVEGAPAPRKRKRRRRRGERKDRPAGSSAAGSVDGGGDDGDDSGNDSDGGGATGPYRDASAPSPVAASSAPSAPSAQTASSAPPAAPTPQPPSAVVDAPPLLPRSSSDPAE